MICAKTELTGIWLRCMTFRDKERAIAMNHVQRIRCYLVNAGNSLYGISPDYNAILRIDENRYKAYIECIFPNVSLYESNLYWAIAKVNKILVGIPCRTNNILLYDIQEKKTAILKLNYLSCGHEYPVEFFYYCVCNNNIFILGTTIPMIIYLNVKEKKIEYLTNAYEQIVSIERYKSRYFFAGGCVQIGKWLYVPLQGYGAIMMVNIITKSTELCFPECDMDGYEGINKIGTEVCLLGRKGKYHYLAFWNPENNKAHINKIPYEGETDLWAAFWPPVYYKSNIYLLPMSADHFFVMNMEEQEMRIEGRFDEFLEGCPLDQVKSKVMSVELSENILTFMTSFDSKWHKVNLGTGECSDYVVELVDKNDWRFYERDVCCREIEMKTIIPEGDITVNNYIDAIISKN